MTPVERMLGEQECAKLIATYARLMDGSRWDDLALLYVAEGRMNRPSAPDEYVIGRDAILASFNARPPRIARHVCANVVVDLRTDTEASATSLILLYNGTAADDGGLPHMNAGQPLVGNYADMLVKTAAGWRFLERRGGMDFRP